MMAFSKALMPTLGVGLGYRSALHRQIVSSAESIDWLEIISDQFMPLNGPRAARLAELASLYTCVPHSLELSVASISGAPAQYMTALCEFVNVVKPPWFSDHLAFNRLTSVNLGSFMPPYRDDEAVARISGRARALQEATGTVLLLENIASLIDPGGSIDEPTFMNMIADEADCGILLDLANLHARCLCTGWDARAFLRQLNLERVVQIHLAGGRWHEGYLRDTHDQPVAEHVWDLLAAVSGETEIRGVLLERDDNFPDDIGELLGELSRARAILGSVGPATVSDGRSAAQGQPPLPAARLVAESQADLERLLEQQLGIGSGAGRQGPAAGPATVAERENIQAFFDEAASKRLTYVAVAFPLTMELLERAGHARLELARDFFGQAPRSRSREDVAGFQAAEIEQFLSYVPPLAARLSAPQLEILALFESEIAMAASGHEQPDSGDTEEAQCCCCNYFRADARDLILCPAARLAQLGSARLVELPFDAARVCDELRAAPEPDLRLLSRLAESHSERVNLAISISETGSRLLFRVGDREFTRLQNPARYCAGTTGEAALGCAIASSRWVGETAQLLRMAIGNRILCIRHTQG